MDHYRDQKVALEEAVRQIRLKRLGVNITVVRPGYIATKPDRPGAADVNNWARTLLDLFNMAKNNTLEIPEISLGPLR
jgi:thioester reductase-like protein